MKPAGHRPVQTTDHTTVDPTGRQQMICQDCHIKAIFIVSSTHSNWFQTLVEFTWPYWSDTWIQCWFSLSQALTCWFFIFFQYRPKWWQTTTDHLPYLEPCQYKTASLVQALNQQKDFYCVETSTIWTYIFQPFICLSKGWDMSTFYIYLHTLYAS